MSDRKTFATMVVDHMQVHSSLLKIHWDDCDMDYRHFWVHFRAPALAKVGRTKHPAFQEASRQVQACMKDAVRFLDGCDYQVTWALHARPVARFRTIDGVRKFDRYSTDTWIYVLSFFG